MFEGKFIIDSATMIGIASLIAREAWKSRQHGKNNGFIRGIGKTVEKLDDDQRKIMTSLEGIKGESSFHHEELIKIDTRLTTLDARVYELATDIKKRR